MSRRPKRHRHRCRDSPPAGSSSTTDGPTANAVALTGNRDTGDLTVCRRPLIIAEVEAGHAAETARPALKGHRRRLNRPTLRPSTPGAVLGVLIVARKYRNPATGTPMRACDWALLLAGDEGAAHPMRRDSPDADVAGRLVGDGEGVGRPCVNDPAPPPCTCARRLTPSTTRRCCSTRSACRRRCAHLATVPAGWNRATRATSPPPPDRGAEMKSHRRSFFTPTTSATAGGRSTTTTSAAAPTPTAAA